MIDEDFLGKYMTQQGFDTRYIDMDFLLKFLNSDNGKMTMDYGFLLALTGLATLKGKELDKLADLEGLPKRRIFESDNRYIKRVREAYFKRRGFDNI